jgi:nucleotide-binding universal stress UspA family protein
MTQPALQEEEAIPPPPVSAVQRRAVLIALHGRRAPVGAIEVARLIAGALEVTLHGLFVWPVEIAASEVPRVLELTPEALEGIVLDVAVGDPVERLGAATAAHPIAFAVVPAEEGGTDVLGLGDFASRSLYAAASAVVLVRPGAYPSAIRRILVPLDGTPETAGALGPAGELARQAGAGLDIVLVSELHPHELPPGAMSPPQYVDQPQHEWAAFSDEFLQRFVSAIAHCPAGVPTRLFLGRGDPAEEILRFATELRADLVALVWNGDLGAEHGLVFRQVVRRAPGPLLVLRR